MVLADISEIDHSVNRSDAEERCAFAADQSRYLGGIVLDVRHDLESARGGVVLRQALQHQK